MSWNDQEDTTIYKVVVNHEQQYSIWPSDRSNALGWTDVGKSGTKAECLGHQFRNKRRDRETRFFRHTFEE